MKRSIAITNKLVKTQGKTCNGSKSKYPEVGKIGTTNIGSGADILYVPKFIKKSEEESLFRQLREEVEWQQQELTIMGKKLLSPRLVTYFADDPELSYRYSGQTLKPTSWHPAVLLIKRKIEFLAAKKFNVCLLNLYRDGKDSLSWHSDCEKEFGDDPMVASLSLGSRRDFLIRRTTDHRKWVWKLGQGDLLIMSGEVQKVAKHAIPKRCHAGERISLTFRWHINGD